ncbi:hypothetical protein [uncultured Ruegeria sp.]|uniref:hypothetical protein n=1 Tax=uncultured Ruegeria sp. TaxID=259304 RepID=UPI00260E1776|nr:hypothetical protein [uncultured Ruegeria sp.]
MGSTGSGSFSDYSGTGNKGGAGGGGSSGEDRCNRAFTCVLEEVEQCEYFGANQDVPPANTPLALELRGRLMAVDANGLSVGALPTRLNFLADCMNAGFAYDGRVVASTTGAVASVNVDFLPRQP